MIDRCRIKTAQIVANAGCAIVIEAPMRFQTAWRFYAIRICRDQSKRHARRVNHLIQSSLQRARRQQRPGGDAGKRESGRQRGAKLKLGLRVHRQEKRVFTNHNSSPTQAIS